MQAVVPGVHLGDVLAGKYRVDRILGRGGMGVVAAAHHVQLDERVAIKFLLPEMIKNAEAVQRFMREARAAVKIKSEHVARVFDVGLLDSGAPYMAMEYLDGEDLAGWLARRGALSVEQTVELVLQACEAVAEAHGLGIVHRDLKPANLFVIRRADGLLSVKVLDFGISKATGIIGEMAKTQSSALMGSPLYMSPEQMRSAASVDSRTDIWALGVIMYELLTRTPPFSAGSLPELYLQVTTAAPVPMRSLRADMPPGLEAAILTCLQKDRERRYSNVADLAAALVGFGPPRARASLERIAGIIRTAGLSTGRSALTPPVAGDGAAPAHSPAAYTSAAVEAGLIAGTTAQPVSNTQASTAQHASPWRALAAGVLALLVGAFGTAAFVVRGRAQPGGAAASASVATVAPPTSAAPSALPAAEPSAPATASTDLADAAPAASTNPAAARPHPQPAALRARAPSSAPGATPTAPPSSPTPAATPSCRLVSFFDSDGNQRFKQECK